MGGQGRGDLARSCRQRVVVAAVSLALATACKAEVRQLARTQPDPAIEDEAHSPRPDGPAIDRGDDTHEQPDGYEIIGAHRAVLDVLADRRRRDQMRPMLTAPRSLLVMPCDDGGHPVVGTKVAGQKPSTLLSLGHVPRLHWLTVHRRRIKTRSCSRQTPPRWRVAPTGRRRQQVIQLDPRIGLPAAPSVMHRQGAPQTLDQIFSGFGRAQDAHHPFADGAAARLICQSVVTLCLRRRLMRRAYPPPPTPWSTSNS